MSRIFKIKKIFRIREAVLDDITLILLIVFNRENPAWIFKMCKIVRIKKIAFMNTTLLSCSSCKSCESCFDFQDLQDYVATTVCRR